MTKQITITLRDWVFNTYLSGPTINMSSKVEDLIIKGAESEIGSYETSKSKILDLIKSNKQLSEEIKNLKLQIGSYKKKYSNEFSPDMQRKIMKADSLKAMGWVR